MSKRKLIMIDITGGYPNYEIAVYCKTVLFLI